MRKKVLSALAVTFAMMWQPLAAAGAAELAVDIKNAGGRMTYKAAKVINGKSVTLKNKKITAKDSNEIALLVANGGHLVLDHCTIVKTGDGSLTAGKAKSGKQHSGQFPQQGPGGGMMGGGPGGPGGPGGGMGGQRPPRDGNGDRQGGPGMGGSGGPGGGMMGGGPGGPGGSGGPGGGPGGDDQFNFYGTNSAVVAVGEGSTIEMIGCTVITDAEYANAVFACDDAQITITDGITIETSKGSSRGLFATCKGVIAASGVVSISTKGAHCAAVATDRGGGTVTVGAPGTSTVSVLNTEGDGSPCIYSTGDITVYNATGTAAASQTMVIEGKNSISVDGCSFAGNSPKHGGIMLYQSMSGDAEVGTSVLNMSRTTIQDNSNTAMILVTNTQTVVNLENCRLLDANGQALSQGSPLVTARNCNNDGGARWGREGSNGGQVQVNLKGQEFTGTLLAAETDSEITVNADAASAVANIQIAQGKGTVKI